MGRCPYCGQNAGLFRSVHKECKFAFDNGKSIILEKVTEAITNNRAFSEYSEEIKSIAERSHIKEKHLGELYGLGYDKAVEVFLEDGVISSEEENSLAKFKEIFGQAVVDRNGSLMKVMRALILRDLLEGKEFKQRVSFDSQLPFVLQKDEYLMWLFDGVDYYETKTITTYEGRSKGVSIKIASGVYYRTGAFKGHPVRSEKMVFVANGVLAMTNINLLFYSQGKSIKIPYKKMIAIEPYSDGLGVQKDGATSKPKTFSNIDGWFAYNLIINLANR